MTESKAKRLISKGLSVLIMIVSITAFILIPYWVGHFMFAISGQEDLASTGDKWGNGFGAVAVVSGAIFMLWHATVALRKSIESKL